jgi:spermidine/putrescine ABC transporter ATP-binding subunit
MELSNAMNAGASSVRIENVSKAFGSTKVLESVDLNIASGEFFSLLGPSGCGKTTLLNILGGLAQPDQGHVRVGGEDITHMPPERRPTNMVFQSYAIFPHLNVAQNVGYGLRRKRLAREVVSRRVGRMLEQVHLDGMADRDPAELSGGQRQRVALARALILEPKVLLLDESLAALDKRLRQAMQVELRQLQRSVGITFVFVTHDQDEAMAVSDRIAVMGEGEVLQVATPRQLYQEPNCRAVAQFIGSINFFGIDKVEQLATGAVLDGGCLGRFRLSNCGTLPVDQTPLVLALRPEALQVSWDKPASADNAVSGRIVETVFLGDRSFARVAVTDKLDPVIAAFPMSEIGRTAIGQTVWLSWSSEAGRLIGGR